MDNKKTKYRRLLHLFDTGTGRISWQIVFAILSLLREMLEGDLSSGVEPFVRNIVIFDDGVPEKLPQQFSMGFRTNLGRVDAEGYSFFLV